MVDSIGSNAGKVSARRIAAVARPVAAPTVATTVALEARVAIVAPRLAARPPVDAERVRAIKAAVESGNFPISPATIADRLIALRYEWMTDDAA